MKIVTVPHTSLRQKATPIKRVDTKLIKLVKDLGQTLQNKRNPQGVGLAAPQVAKNKRLFAMNLPPADQPDAPPKITVYINPQIIDHPRDPEWGPDPEQPTLEGCLSIPKLYGPVPRWRWVQVEYDELVGDELQRRQTKLEWFAARVFQHELDHLDGVLFTDYSLRFDLPVYQENSKRQLVEIDKRLVEGF